MAQPGGILPVIWGTDKLYQHTCKHSSAPMSPDTLAAQPVSTSHAGEPDARACADELTDVSPQAAELIHGDRDQPGGAGRRKALLESWEGTVSSDGNAMGRDLHHQA